MNDKFDFEASADSQYAIIDYMNSTDGNAYMHKARVVVSSRGETQYNRILNVIPGIETNYSFVEIIGDTQFERDYYSKYTNRHQKFSFINDALLIKGDDRMKNSIEIAITRV